MKKNNLYTEVIALCDYASVSREGKLSINGIFDELRIQQFPGGMARAFFVATINGTPNTEYKLSLRLEGKNGEKTPFNDTLLDTMTSANGKNNLIVELINLAFEKEGEYEFKIYHENKEVGSTLLRVFQNSQVETGEKLPN